MEPLHFIGFNLTDEHLCGMALLPIYVSTHRFD